MNWTIEEVKELVSSGVKQGLKFIEDKKYDDAEILLKQVLKIDTDNADALKMMGLIKLNKQQYEKGEELLTIALKSDPDDSQTHNNLALCLANQGKISAAIEHFEEAIRLKRCHVYMNNLAIQYRRLLKLGNAEWWLQESLRITPHPFTYAILGGVYGQMKRLEDCQRVLGKALDAPASDWEDAPGSREGVYIDLFYARTLQGYFDPLAWSLYENRFKCFPQLASWNRLYGQKKSWLGDCPTEGKRLLVYTEQGAGDAIHFARYLPLMREKTKPSKVILHCPVELRSLLAPLVDETFILNPDSVTDENMPEYDLQCSLLSLPCALASTDIPSAPYLNIKKKASLENYSNYYKIGIVWAGSPLHPNDANRSCYLKEFKPIHDLPGVKLFSLQKDTRKRVYRDNPNCLVDYASGCEDMNIVDMSEHMTDFEETGAIINELDLVVTVDTSVGHLAGAIGKEVWMMIPWNPDWRWKIKGDTTDWYPSMRLFRQESEPTAKRDLGWTPVIQRIAEAIQKEKL